MIKLNAKYLIYGVDIEFNHERKRDLKVFTTDRNLILERKLYDSEICTTLSVENGYYISLPCSNDLVGEFIAIHGNLNGKRNFYVWGLFISKESKSLFFVFV